MWVEKVCSMLKKIFFISLCLSLVFSPLAYGQQATEQNLFKKLTPEIIQAVEQEIERLTPNEKLTLQESLLKTVEQLPNKEKALFLSYNLFSVGVLFLGIILGIIYERQTKMAQPKKQYAIGYTEGFRDGVSDATEDKK